MDIGVKHLENGHKDYNETELQRNGTRSKDKDHVDGGESYKCPRCKKNGSPENLFKTHRKLAIHYDEHHRGFEKDLQTVGPFRGNLKKVQPCPKRKRKMTPAFTVGASAICAQEQKTIREEMEVARNPERNQPPGENQDVNAVCQTGGIENQTVVQGHQHQANRDFINVEEGAHAHFHVHQYPNQSEIREPSSTSHSVVATKSSASSSLSSGEHPIMPTILQPVTHVTNNTLVVMSDMSLDKQNELKVQMEAEKDLPDKLIYWRVMLRCDDVRSRLFLDIDPLSLVNAVPGLVTRIQESEVKSTLNRDGRERACQRLLDILSRSADIEWPETFLNGIREMGQELIADFLEDKIKEVQKKEANHYREKVIHNHFEAITSSHQLLPVKSNPALHNGANQQLCNPTQFLALPSTHNTAEPNGKGTPIPAATGQVTGAGDNAAGPGETNVENSAEQENTITVSDEDVAKTSVPRMEYRNLTFDVFDALTDRQFRKIKHLFGDEQFGIPRESLNKITDREKLLDCMEKYNFLSSENTWCLQRMLYYVGSKPLYKKVTDFATSRFKSCNTLHVYEPREIQGKDCLLTLKVKGNIKHFREIDVEVFKDLLLRHCGAEYICEVGTQEGSVILFFQVPSQCKQYFTSINQEFITWCEENGVIEAYCQGESVYLYEGLNPNKADENMFKRKGTALLDALKDDVKGFKESASTTDTADLKIHGKPLMVLATESNCQDIAKYLISSGSCNMNETDRMGATALHMAVFLDHRGICEDLLERKDIDVNAVDKNGNTPLHLAAHQDNYLLTFMLMDHDASTTINNKAGHTAVDVARTNNYASLLNALNNHEVEDAAILVAVAEDSINCPICLRAFKQPKILPCGHSFCEVCLKRQIQMSDREKISTKEELLTCSKCKQEAKVPYGGIEDFPLNKTLAQQIHEARYFRNRKQSQDAISMEKQSTSEFNTPVNENRQPAEIKKSSASVFVKVSLHSLTCKLCHKLFQSPVRKLDCTHSFCESCLEQFVEEHRTFDLICSICLEETLVPSGEIQKLRKDFNLESQLDDNMSDIITKPTTDIGDEYDDGPDYIQEEAGLGPSSFPDGSYETMKQEDDKVSRMMQDEVPKQYAKKSETRESVAATPTSKYQKEKQTDDDKQANETEDVDVHAAEKYKMKNLTMHKKIKSNSKFAGNLPENNGNQNEVSTKPDQLNEWFLGCTRSGFDANQPKLSIGNCDSDIMKWENGQENRGEDLEADAECFGDDIENPSVEENGGDNAPKTLDEGGGQMGESSMSLDSGGGVSEDSDWIKVNPSDVERKEDSDNDEPSSIQMLRSNVNEIEVTKGKLCQQSNSDTSTQSLQQPVSASTADTGLKENEHLQKQPQTEYVAQQQQQNTKPAKDDSFNQQHEAVYNADREPQKQQKPSKPADKDSCDQQHNQQHRAKINDEGEQQLQLQKTKPANEDSHDQQHQAKSVAESEQQTQSAKPVETDTPQQQHQQHQTGKVDSTEVNIYSQQMSQTNIAVSKDQPLQEQTSKVVKAKVCHQQQAQSVPGHKCVQEQQNDGKSAYEQSLPLSKEQSKQMAAENRQQSPDQQQIEKPKTKKKLRNPLKNLKKKFRKIKNQKSKDAETSEPVEKTQEAVASVSSPDEDVVDKSTGVRMVEGDAHVATQESSTNRDEQLVTAGASSGSLDVIESSESLDVDELIPVIRTKQPAPRLDTSRKIEVKYKPPVRNTLAPNHSPTEQFYDILMMHSLKKEDLDELDYIKKIGKRYGWKIISVEDFPAGMTKFEIFATMLPRCTYTVLLLTTNFVNDVWCNHRYAACLTAAVENRSHQWSVIPIVYEDNIFETPLELTTIAGLQRDARYFRKNLRSMVSTALRKEREEELGFPSEPSPPPSPSPPDSPVLKPKPCGAPAKPVIKEEDASQMTPGEIFRQLKPELAPSEPVTKLFSDDDRFRRICTLLDLDHCLGRDYRLLAQMIGFSTGEIRSLGQEGSPTARILEVYCIKNAAKPKMEVLETMLKMVTALEQFEVKGLIENEIMVAKFTT